jgi:hypothetical protein
MTTETIITIDADTIDMILTPEESEDMDAREIVDAIADRYEELAGEYLTGEWRVVREYSATGSHHEGHDAEDTTSLDNRVLIDGADALRIALGVQ